MQGYNCIIIYDKTKTNLLFCKRTKDPYKGLFNLVGGKIEPNEDGFIAAYRELEEETGITNQNIKLHHMMDFTYYNQECYVEVYAGILLDDVVLKEEAHPLVWLDLSENFFALDRFAGEGNIGHMIEQVNCYGLGITS
jgi:8-oxo-dGTP diphosphatase